MRPLALPASAALAVLLGLLPALGGEPLRLVVVTPGQPGGSEEARPVLDRLSRWIEGRLSRNPGTVSVLYEPDLEAGRAALEEGADYAILPLSLLLAWDGPLDGLRPLTEIETTEGGRGAYALVRPSGAKGSLDGVTVRGTACTDENFVRSIVLRGYPGAEGSRPVFARRTLSALRALAGGEPGAVLLDAVQAEALGSLPFAKEMEVVHRSPELPGLFLAAVGGGGRPAEEARALREAFLALRDDEEGAGLADEMRVKGIRPANESEIAALRAAYRGGGPEAPD